MIRSTFGGFMTARLGMSAAQQGLNLTGHNLTNSATTGYTRQRIDQVSLNTSGNYRYASPYSASIGNGVLVTGTSQLRDPFLDLRYRNETSNVGYENVRNNVLNDLADILDEVKNSTDDALSGGGIFNQLGDILEKLQQLSNQVGNKEFDGMVKTSCQQLITLFNSYSARIDEVADNLKDDLTNVDVPRVNEILKNISELNKTIKSSEIHGESALELKDERNLLIDELSQYMKINVKYTPVRVSDSTTIEELSITMENYDPQGKDYKLVDGEQYRQLECAQDENTGDWNITLSKMYVDCNPPQETAVDPDTASAYQSAIQSLQNAIAKYDPDKLANAYIDAHTKFQAAITDKTNADNLVTTRTDEYNKAVTAYNEAKTALDEEKAKLKELQNQNPPVEADIAAQKAVVTQKQEEVDKAKQDRINANNAKSEAEKEQRLAQKAYNTAKDAYDEAYENLPADLTKAPNWELKEVDGEWTLTKKTVDLTTTLANYNKLPDNTAIPNPDTEGRGKSSTKLDQLATKFTNAKQAYADSIKESAAITTDPDDPDAPALVINDIFTDGKLRGTLEMLNKEGTYDDSDVRGIGYYKNMLDTLANTFANEMNKLNGEGKPLFTTKDGGTDGMTASDIRIAEDWMSNKYGITASTQVDPADPWNTVDGANDNILRFIQLFDTDVSYTTHLDGAEAGSVYLDENNNPVLLDANGKKIEYDSYSVELTDGQTVDVTPNRPLTEAQLALLPKDSSKYYKYQTDVPIGAASVKTVKEVFNGTFEEMFTNIGTTLGLDIKGAAENLANYELLASDLSEERDGVTGVSLDEEAMAIMQYSQSYNASARLMTALDEMLETLISNTGVVGR